MDISTYIPKCLSASPTPPTPPSLLSSTLSQNLSTSLLCPPTPSGMAALSTHVPTACYGGFVNDGSTNLPPMTIVLPIPKMMPGQSRTFPS